MSGPRASKTHQNSTSTSVQDTPELDVAIARQRAAQREAGLRLDAPETA